MCYTTTVVFDYCGHESHEVRQDSRCAIGYVMPSSQFHWRRPEGIIHRADICSVCKLRLRRYGCLDADQLAEVQAATGSRASLSLSDLSAASRPGSGGFGIF